MSAPPAWGAGISGVALLAARSALRARLVPLAALLLLGVLGGLAASGLGDESPAGRLRAFLSLGGSFVSFVLALCAIFLPSRLALDLRLGRLTQVVTGPLSRGGLLLAWWLGTTAVLGALVALSYGLLGLGAEAVLRFGDPHGVDPAALRARVLRGRAVARPEVPDPAEFAARAEQLYADRLAQGVLPPDLDPEEALAQLRAALEQDGRTLAPGVTKTWEIGGHSGSEEVVLRFRFAAQWPRWKPLNQRTVALGLRLEAAEEGASWSWEPPPARYQPNAVHELVVQGDLLQGARRVRVVLRNEAQDGAVVIVPREGPSLLFPAGGFARNLLRAAWVELCRLAFLAAVGAVMAALFDGKLAMLAVLWVVALGYGQGFLTESLRPGSFGAADALLLGLLEGILACVPDLGRAELGAALADGEAIPRAWLQLGALDLGLRTPLLLGLGALLFARRELGAAR